MHEAGPTPTDALTGAVATGMLAATCRTGVLDAGGEVVVGDGVLGDGVWAPEALGEPWVTWPPWEGSDLGVVWAGEPLLGSPVDATTADIEGAAAGSPLAIDPLSIDALATAPLALGPGRADTGPATAARLVSAVGPVGEAADPGKPEGPGEVGTSSGPMWRTWLGGAAPARLGEGWAWGMGAKD